MRLLRSVLGALFVLWLNLIPGIFMHSVLILLLFHFFFFSLDNAAVVFFFLDFTLSLCFSCSSLGDTEHSSLISYPNTLWNVIMDKAHTHTHTCTHIKASRVKRICLACNETLVACDQSLLCLFSRRWGRLTLRDLPKTRGQGLNQSLVITHSLAKRGWGLE